MIMPGSWLYVPADKPELYAKARAAMRDALLFDLEHAVPVQRSVRTRKDLQPLLRDERSPRSPRSPQSIGSPPSLSGRG
jgi:citrate lyase subunit beta/citryl-CoA lyase